MRLGLLHDGAMVALEDGLSELETSALVRLVNGGLTPVETRLMARSGSGGRPVRLFHIQFDRRLVSQLPGSGAGGPVDSTISGHYRWSQGQWWLTQFKANGRPVSANVPLASLCISSS